MGMGGQYKTLLEYRLCNIMSSVLFLIFTTFLIAMKLAFIKILQEKLKTQERTSPSKQNFCPIFSSLFSFKVKYRDQSLLVP